MARPSQCRRWLLLAGALLSATKASRRPLVGRRLDDGAAETCGPLLDAYYACEGLTDDAEADDPSYYYYFDDDGDADDVVAETCAFLARGDCETAGTSPSCRDAYETALECYSEALCGTAFACVAQPDAPTDEVVTFATLGFYNSDPATPVACFSYGTTTAPDRWSGPVAFGAIVYVDVFVDAARVPSDPAEAVPVYFRVYAGCPDDATDPGTAVSGPAPASVAVYASATNLARWGLDGSATITRRIGPEPAVYLLNQVSATTPCAYAWGSSSAGTNASASSSSGTAVPDLAARALVTAVDDPVVLDALACEQWATTATLTVACGEASTAVLAIRADELCPDTSMHFVALTEEDTGDVAIRLFEATATCAATCGGSSKKKNNKSSSPTSWIVLLAVVVAVGVLTFVALVVATLLCSRKGRGLCAAARASSMEASPADDYETDTALPHAALEMKQASSASPSRQRRSGSASDPPSAGAAGVADDTSSSDDEPGRIEFSSLL